VVLSDLLTKQLRSWGFIIRCIVMAIVFEKSFVWSLGTNVEGGDDGIEGFLPN
jgi:hypothetical protein